LLRRGVSAARGKRREMDQKGLDRSRLCGWGRAAGGGNLSNTRESVVMSEEVCLLVLLLRSTNNVRRVVCPKAGKLGSKTERTSRLKMLKGEALAKGGACEGERSGGNTGARRPSCFTTRSPEGSKSKRLEPGERSPTP